MSVFLLFYASQNEIFYTFCHFKEAIISFFVRIVTFVSKIDKKTY